MATTLALLALLVLISLALVAVIRVETRVGDDSAQLQDAQRNALVGLNQAIAQLQRYAGPDQAVTARADILANSAWQSPTVGNANPSGINNPFRTGVWPITNTGNLGTPVWLVSGRAEQTGGPDPVSPTSARLSPTAIGSGDFEELHLNVKLVGAGTSWPYPSAEIADQSAHDVVVRKEFLRIPAEVANGVPANQNVVGSFAYWVGDEGTKASLALQPQLNEVTYSLYSVAEQRQRLVQLAATDVFRNLFVSGFPLSADMSKMTSSNQLPFYNIPLRDAYQRQVRRYYHGLTVMSRGVLANTLPRANGGGLKRDLSASTIGLGTPYAEIGDYLNHTSYMRSSENSSDLWREYRIVPPASVSPAAGRPIHSVAPVLTEFALQFGFSVAGGTLQARVRTRAELWNPYTSALVSENLRLVVSGFPEMQVTGATPNVFPLNAALGGELVINLSPPTPRWLPGRFINWSGDLDPVIDTLNDSTTWVTGFNPAVSVPGPVAQLQLAFSSCRLTVRLETASGAVLARYADIPFNAVPDGAIAPYAKTSTAMRLGYHFRLREAADSADWLNTFDPRAPNLPASAFVISSAPETQSGASIISSSSTTFLFAKAATDKSFNRDVPIFELPRQPNVSLGQLQHVQVASQPPFVIGNADGNIDQLNLLFDRFFFSGLRSSDSVPEAENGQVPNLRLELFSRGSAFAKLSDVKTAGENAAKTLLVKGAFNVNSTSKEAWEAVLNGGLLRTFNYVNADGTTGMPIGVTSVGSTFPSIFRFSQSAQETYLATAAGLNRFYRRGARNLTQDEVSSLATQIVNRVKAKGASSGPFRSIADFLAPKPEFGGRSILDAAIRASTLFDSTIPSRATLAVSAADLMTALAPFVSVRSDTFLIRAYGDTINPVTKSITARAWCEAVVQRIPEPVEFTGVVPSDTEYATPPGVAGRRFKVISFRWLGPDDI